MNWVTATNISQWADTIGSRIDLSELVAALVRGSASKMGEYRFPTGDSAQLHGYDGVLEAAGVPPFVPDGTSVWEFGTSADFKGKANDDYKNRTANPGTVTPATTTLVIVSARKWDSNEKAKWEQDRRANAIWKDVRVIDAVDLEAWLDLNSAVAAKFASTVLKIVPAHVQSSQDYWDHYAARTKPRLNERIVTAGRGEQVKTVSASLGERRNRIVVRGDSRDEAVAFVIGAARSADDETRKFLEARMLVVDNEDVAKQLLPRQGLIIALLGQAADSAGALIERGNIVVLPLGNDAPNQRDAIRLPRPARSEFAEALTSMGVDEGDAERMARECGRSVTILLRRIPSGVRRDPEWLGNAANRDALIPALLAGSWDSSSQADKDVLAKLSGMSYPALENLLRPLLRVSDPPLQQIGTVWTTVAPVDLFESLAPYVSPHQLDQLRSACRTALGEVDPAIDLPVDERQYAALHGKVLEHSAWIRDGLTQTLLLIAVRGADANLDCPSGAQNYTNSVIAELPGLAKDHRLISSLHHQLPLLMEAAPDPLLLALEQMLEGDGTVVKGLFSEGGWFGGSSYHTGLLWALEAVAWDPNYLDRAVSVLVKLAKIDPGGKLSNRPLNSLRTIFLPWLPSTNASLETRIATLDSVIRREPTIAWSLLSALLPSFHDSSSPASKPRWRDAGASERELLTRKIVRETYRAVIDRALQLAGDDSQRWERIIGSMHAFESSLLAKVREGLVAFRQRVKDESARFAVWSSLRQEIVRHRSFADADWAMPPAELDAFDEVLGELSPRSVVEQNVWLFDDYYPDLPNVAAQDKHDAADQPRREALERILKVEGVDGVLRLAAKAKFPALVGSVTADVLPSIGEAQQLISEAVNGTDALVLFAGALAGETQRKFGAALLEWIVSRAKDRVWTPTQVSGLLLFFPDEPATWKMVADLGSEIEKEYWTRKPLWRLKDPEARTIAIRKYISVGRGLLALAQFSHQAESLPSGALLDLIDAATRELASGQVKPSGNFGYELEEVFDVLTGRADVERIEIARREYTYLAALDHGRRSLVLHEFMTKDPDFYVQVLTDVFKAATAEPEDKVSEEKAQRARMGYRLLHSMKRLPGLRADGSLDAAEMRQWVLNVRERAAKADRADIADDQVGRLLGHSPDDPSDKSWPHRDVRDLLEELRSDVIEAAMISEQVNKRGVFTKAPFEGGGQERGFAERARTRARESRGWPRTAAMLEREAEMWESYARREDEEAAKHKEKFG